jgi:hypothetical protein
VLVLVALLVLTAGCSSRHIIHQQVAMSRDFTYIEFSRDTTPYIHRGPVGGEHSTFIKVLGFEGDCFTIEMQQKGDAGFTVFSEGGQVERDKSLYKVTINAPSDLFTIDISALSYADYVLTITKENQ